MGHSDSGFRLVDLLPALASTPHRVPLKIRFIDLELFRGRLVERCDRDGRGLNSPSPLSRRNPLPAMSTRLIAEYFLCARSRYSENRVAGPLLHDFKLKDPSAMPRGRRWLFALRRGALRPRRLLLL